MSYFNKVDSAITSPLTAFGDLRTAMLSPIFQYSFEYTVSNTDLVTNVLTNGGTVTQSSGMAVVGSSTTTVSTACMQSKKRAKYKAGLGGLFRFTTLFETGGVAATEQYAGLADEAGSSAAFENGYMIGFDGTVFGLHRFQNDVKTSIAQSAWDDPLDGTGSSGMTLDTSKLNVWEIRYQYLGAGAITLHVEDDSTGEFVTVHKILYANLNTSPSCFNPNFLGVFYVDNAGTTTDLVLKTSSMAYFVEGQEELKEVHRPIFASGVKSKTSVTTEVPILTIRNKTTYASKSNFIEIIIELVSASVEANTANNLAELRMVKNATLGGTPSWSDISATNSVVEVDNAATSLSGGEELLDTELAGKNDKDRLVLQEFKILVEPGETITIAGQSVGSATMKASVSWRELF